MNQLKGSLMLLLAAFFWGTTFVAQTSASDAIGAFTFNATRSFVGAAFLGGLILTLNKTRNKKDTKYYEMTYKEVNGEKIESTSEITSAHNKKSVIFAGFICGVVLFAAMNFQQWGIVLYPSSVASSGRSGFLTATYVVIIALCSKFLGKKIHRVIYVSVVLCIIGLYMLCVTDGFSSIYLGDILGIICAFCFALHIIVVDKFSYCESVKLSCMQFLSSGILSFVAMLIFEEPTFTSIKASWMPILYAGIFSSGIAYTLQMSGQKYAEPAVASVVMSLESVFAALGGWIVLNETLSSREIIGCVTVFAAVILAQTPSMIKKKNNDKIF